MLDAKIAPSSMAGEKAQLDDRFFRGRQIAFVIYEYFRVTGAHETVLNCSDLLRVTSQGDDVQGFDTRRDEVLLSIRQVPSDDILRIWECDQLKTVLAMSEQEIE